MDQLSHKTEDINCPNPMRFHPFTFTGNDPRKGWRIPLDEIKYNEQRDEEKEMSGGHFASERGEEPRSGMQYCSSLSFTNFGARYMDHELMTMWLSVDPMADKYPSISPYAYCAWNPVKLVDPDGREVSLSDGWPPLDEWNKCSSQEKIFILNHPNKARKMYSNMETAVEMSRETYPDLGGRGTERDAYRHAMWQALNVQSVGEEATREMGNAHEYRDGQPMNDMIMDIHNNEIGIEIGRENPNASPEELSQIILNRISAGDMIILVNNNTKMTKSNGEAIKSNDIRGLDTVKRIVIVKKGGSNEKKQNY